MQQLNEDFFDKIRPEDMDTNPADDVKNTDNSRNEYPFFIELNRLYLHPSSDYATWQNKKFFPKEENRIDYDFYYKYQISMFYRYMKQMAEHINLFNDGYSLNFLLKISVTQQRRWVETVNYDPDKNWKTVFDMFDVDKYVREYKNDWTFAIEVDILFDCREISYENFCKDMLHLINYMNRVMRAGNRFDFRIGLMNEEFSQNITFENESRDDEFRRIYNALFNLQTEDDKNEEFTVRANTVFNISGLKYTVEKYVENAKHVVAYDKVDNDGISRHTYSFANTSNTIPTKHNLAIVDLTYHLNYDGMPAIIILEDLAKNLLNKLSPIALTQMTICIRVHYTGGKPTMPEVKMNSLNVNCPSAHYRAVLNNFKSRTTAFKTFFRYYMKDPVDLVNGRKTNAYVMFIINEKKNTFFNSDKVMYFSSEMWAQLIQPVWKP